MTTSNPTAAPPQLSPDGYWWWTGADWVPAAERPAEQAGVGSARPVAAEPVTAAAPAVVDVAEPMAAVAPVAAEPATQAAVMRKPAVTGTILGGPAMNVKPVQQIRTSTEATAESNEPTAAVDIAGDVAVTGGAPVHPAVTARSAFAAPGGDYSASTPTVTGPDSAKHEFAAPSDNVGNASTPGQPYGQAAPVGYGTPPVGYGQPPPGYGTAPAWAAPQNPATDGLAIACLICGVLGVFGLTALASLICGNVSRKRAKAAGVKPNVMTTIGLAFALLWLLGLTLSVINTGIAATREDGAPSSASTSSSQPRDTASGTQVIAALRSASTSEEAYRLEHGTYTTDTTALRQVGMVMTSGTTVTVLRASPTSYCLRGTSPSSYSYFDSTKTAAQSTSCA